MYISENLNEKQIVHALNFVNRYLDVFPHCQCEIDSMVILINGETEPDKLKHSMHINVLYREIFGHLAHAEEKVDSYQLAIPHPTGTCIPSVKEITTFLERRNTFVDPETFQINGLNHKVNLNLNEQTILPVVEWLRKTLLNLEFSEEMASEIDALLEMELRTYYLQEVTYKVIYQAVVKSSEPLTENSPGLESALEQEGPYDYEWDISSTSDENWDIELD